MLTPKTNSLTYWPKEVSPEMNGITFSVCSTLWISRCILLAISVMFSLTIRLESRAPCRKQVRRRLRMKALWRRKRSHVWCCASEGVRKSLHEVWDLWSIRWMPMKEKKSYKHPGNWCKPTQIQKWWYYQTSRQENVPQASSKLVQDDQNRLQSDERKYSNSTSSRKLASSSELKKHGIHEPSIHEQDLSDFAEEVGFFRNKCNFPDGSIQNKCFGCRECLWLRRWKSPSTLGRIMCRKDVYDFVDVSRHPPWAELCVEFGKQQEQKIRGYWECIQHYSKVGNGTFWRNSECEMLGVFITFLGEIGISQHQAIKSANAKVCVYADSVLSVGEMKDTPEAIDKMGKSSGRTQVVFVLPRCSGNQWRTHHCLFFNKSSATWRKGNPARGMSRTGSSSRQCSMTLSEKRMMRNCISNAEKVKNYAMKFSQEHWTFLGPGSEEKWYGSSSHARKRAMELYSRQNGATVQRSWSSCVQKYQCLESWNLKTKER